MKIKIAHEIQKDKSGKIRFRRFKKGGYDHYRLRLFLEGDDLPEVSYVEYELHPTFSNRYRTVEDPNDNFSLSIWTWGEFDVAVNVVFKNGKSKTHIYPLAYSHELPIDDDEYADESPRTYKER